MSFSSAHKVEIPPVKLVVIGNEPEPVAKLGDSRIEQFLDLKDVAPKTRQTYEQQLRWFSEWVAKDWLEIHLNDIRGYKLYLEQDRGLKPNSVALALVTLKGFYRWLIKAGGHLEKFRNDMLVPNFRGLSSQGIFSQPVQLNQ